MHCLVERCFGRWVNLLLYAWYLSFFFCLFFSLSFFSFFFWWWRCFCLSHLMFSLILCTDFSFLCQYYWYSLLFAKKIYLKNIRKGSFPVLWTPLRRYSNETWSNRMLMHLNETWSNRMLMHSNEANSCNCMR